MHTRVVWISWKPCGRPFTEHVIHWLISSRYFPSDCKHLPCHLQPFDILTQSLKASNVLLFAGHEYTTALADEKRHKVVAKPVALVSCSQISIMVTCTSLGLLIIEWKLHCVSRASLLVAQGIIKIAPKQLFYLLLTNLSEKRLFTPKHMIIAQALGKLQLSTPTEAILLGSESTTVAAVHYEPSVDR